MPYISVKTSVPVSSEKEAVLKAAFGQAITSFPGKSEQWLMVQVEENCRLWFQGGNDRPAAFVEVKLFGQANDKAYAAMTAKTTAILNTQLAIPADRIYVKYEEVAHWGWNGSNF